MPKTIPLIEIISDTEEDFIEIEIPESKMVISNKDDSTENDNVLLIEDIEAQKFDTITIDDHDIGQEPVFSDDYSTEDIVAIFNAMEDVSRDVPSLSTVHKNGLENFKYISNETNISVSDSLSYPLIQPNSLCDSTVVPNGVINQSESMSFNPLKIPTDYLSSEEIKQIERAIVEADKLEAKQFLPSSSSTSSTCIAGDSISEEDQRAISEALQELENIFPTSVSISNISVSSESSILKHKKEAITLLDYEDYDRIGDEMMFDVDRSEKINTLNVTNPELELLDPNPCIIDLYRHFDKRFFYGFLTTTPLRLGWANNFFTLAGAFYSYKDGSPTILLSAKLLNLRPRKDLVETLLHEMIHAYLYLKRIKDTNDHGVKFHEQMHRINNEAKTNITVYHSFHDEVDHLRKYVWRCSGTVCQNLQPNRGYISLPTKRKPNGWDYVFKIHKRNGCNGNFEKVSNNF